MSIHSKKSGHGPSYSFWNSLKPRELRDWSLLDGSSAGEPRQSGWRGSPALDLPCVPTPPSGTHNRPTFNCATSYPLNHGADEASARLAQHPSLIMPTRHLLPHPRRNGVQEPPGALDSPPLSFLVRCSVQKIQEDRHCRISRGFPRIRRNSLISPSRASRMVGVVARGDCPSAIRGSPPLQKKSRRRSVPFWCSQSPFFPEGDRDGGGLCSEVS